MIKIEAVFCCRINQLYSHFVIFCEIVAKGILMAQYSLDSVSSTDFYVTILSTVIR